MDTEQTTAPAVDGPQEAADAAAVDGLGDAGKKALQALRQEVKDLRAQLKQAQAAGTDATRDAGEQDEAATSEERDAPTTDEAGERDAADTVEEPPRARFQGTADGGPRGTITPALRQYGRDDLRGMTAAQITAARRKGQLRDILGGR